jgi:hypothetical protein
MNQPKFSGEFEEQYYHKEGYIPLDPNTFYNDTYEQNVQKPTKKS